MRYLHLLFILPFLLSSCADVEPVTEDEQLPLVIKEARFSDLPNWNADNHGQVLEAFAKSCERMLKRSPESKFGNDVVQLTYGDWRPACEALPNVTPQTAQQYFENYFSPYRATSGGVDSEGLFTGYYEASLNGSRTKVQPYVYPLYARPEDLVMVDLGQFREHLKGERIAGRVVGGNLKPYEDRAEIVAGDWPHNDKVLVWVDDPVASFFLHIQGSGVVAMNDGTDTRVGYAGQNGHPYYAIGRELIARGELTKEEVSLQSIRAWLQAHPDQADEIMNTNKSYVFFRELDTDGPVGGEGLTLTPERSLAVDRTMVPYGTPLWVDIAPPVEGEAPLQKLMVAQDTGGAIRGAVRGDVFWGYGDRAEHMAGMMKSKGRYWLLLPKPVTAGGDAQ